MIILTQKASMLVLKPKPADNRSLRISTCLILFMSLFSFFLCMPCSARHLGVTDKRIGRKVHLIGKDLVQDVLNRKLHNTLAPTLQRSEPAELRAQEKKTTGTGERKTLETSALSNTLKEKDSMVILKEDKNKGREVAISYSEEYSQEATEVEGWRRSTFGSAPHKAAEETVNSKESDIVEDIVVMDYAQPHRKPPIHNIKP